MEFELKDLNPTKKAISFKFFKEEIEKEKNIVVNKLRKMANLPGFRPGKVPPEIIKARFKKEIEEDILENLTGKNVEEIIKEKKWKIIGEIIFSEKSYENEYFKSEVEFFIIPKIDLPTLEGVELKKEEIIVSDKEIEEEIEKFRRSKGKVEEIDEPIKDEYYALCKLEGNYENDDKLIDFGYQYLSPTGKNPVPELLGKRKNDEVKFSKDFPPDDPSPHRGKKVNFKASIEEIKIFIIPELSIDLIKEELPDIKNMEEFKDFIRKKLLNEKKRKADVLLKEDILNQLLSKVDISVPEPLLDREIKKHIQETAIALYEENYDLKNMDWEKMYKNYEPKAVKKLQKTLLLDAFADSFNIEVSDEEVINDIKKFCEINKLDYEKKIKEYRQKETFEEIRLDIKMDKALDKIIEKINSNLQK